MKKLFLFLIYLFSFIFLLVVFLPKQELYYFVLKELGKNEVVLDEKEFVDTHLGFDMKDTKVFVKGIEASNVEKLDLDVYLFINTLQIDNVKISENFKQFVPSEIKSIDAKYSVLNPLFVNIYFKGDEFKADGVVDIINRKIIINLYPSNKFIRSYGMLLGNMKKVNPKEYRYEYSF